MADISLNDLASYWPLYRPEGPGFKPKFAYPIPDSEPLLPGVQTPQPTDGVPEPAPEHGGEQFRSLWIALMTGRDETFDQDGAHEPDSVVGTKGEGPLPGDADEDWRQPRLTAVGPLVDTWRPVVPALVGEFPPLPRPRGTTMWDVSADSCPGADVLIRGCTPQRVLPHVGTFSTEPIDSKPMVIVGGALMLPLFIEAAAAAFAAKGLFEGAAVALSWGRAVALAL